MIKKIFTSTIVLITLCGASVASATCGINGCTGKINQVYVTGGTKVYIETDQLIGPLDCTPVSSKYLTLIKGTQNPLFDEMYSMVLASKFSGTNVKFRIVNGSPICEIDYAVSLID